MSFNVSAVKFVKIPDLLKERGKREANSSNRKQRETNSNFALHKRRMHKPAGGSTGRPEGRGGGFRTQRIKKKYASQMKLAHSNICKRTKAEQHLSRAESSLRKRTEQQYLNFCWFISQDAAS